MNNEKIDIPDCWAQGEASEKANEKIDAPQFEKGSFRKKLSGLINSYSMENNSDTPDFILAMFLGDCLETFDKAVKRRSEWYNHDPWGDKDKTSRP